MSNPFNDKICFSLEYDRYEKVWFGWGSLAKQSITKGKIGHRRLDKINVRGLVVVKYF